MTSQEQASKILEWWKTQIDHKLIVHADDETTLRKGIAQALDAARRETWEATAQEAARFLMPTTVNVQFIAWCRAQALDVARRETWMEAAKHWDTMAEGPWKDGDLFEAAMYVANWCRQQATAQADKEA